MIFDHAPIPGPLHWDFRCRVCSEDVDQHAGVIARWRWRRERKNVGPEIEETQELDVHEEESESQGYRVLYVIAFLLATVAVCFNTLATTAGKFGEEALLVLIVAFLWHVWHATGTR